MDRQVFLNYVLYTLTSIFAVCIFAERNARPRFWLRMGLFGLGAVVLCLVLALLYDAQMSALGTDGISYSLLSISSYAAIVVGWREKASRCVYTVIAGTLIRTAGSKLVRIPMEFWQLPDFLGHVVTALFVLLTYVPVWLLMARNVARDPDFAPDGKSLFTLFVFVTVVMIASYIEPVLREADYAWYIYFLLLEAILCYMFIVFQYLMYRGYKKDMLAAYESRLKEQRVEQVNHFMSVVEVMNIKCHDLRHHIGDLEPTRRVDGDLLKKLKRTADEYEAFVHTGNSNLDAILTEKKFACLQKDICMYIMADGMALSFLSVEDMHTLFGNALENAVEYLTGVADMDCRWLKVTTSRTDRFLILSVENYCSVPPKFDGKGLPVSEKSDSFYHGFGAKSIKKTAERYGGEVSFIAEDETFAVKAIFPLGVVPDRNGLE